MKPLFSGGGGAGESRKPTATTINTAVGVISLPPTAEGVMRQTIIHAVFILSAIGIAWTDRIMLASPPAKAAKH